MKTYHSVQEIKQRTGIEIPLLFDKPLAEETLQILDHTWFKTFIRNLDGQVLAQLPCDSDYKNIARFFEEIHQEIVFNIGKIIANFNASNNASSDVLHLNSEIKIAVRNRLKLAAKPFTSDDPIKHYLLLLVSHLMELSIIPQHVTGTFPHAVETTMYQQMYSQ